jgi:two-component system LytT family response regulator
LARARATLDAAAARTDARAGPPERRTLAAHDRVTLREAEQTRFCRVGDIVFIRAAGDYTEVHLSDGTSVLVVQSLRRWRERIPDTFVPVHRPTLVNLARAERLWLSSEGWRVQLRGRPEPFAVSRRYARALKAHLDRLQP